MTGEVENVFFKSNSIPHMTFLIRKALMCFNHTKVVNKLIGENIIDLMEVHRLVNCYGAQGRFLIIILTFFRDYVDRI